MVSIRGKIKSNFLPDQICQKINYFLALKWQQKKQPKSRLNNIDLPPPPDTPGFTRKRALLGGGQTMSQTGKPNNNTPKKT